MKKVHSVKYYELFCIEIAHMLLANLMERITYKLRTCSLSKNIIYESLLNFNGRMEKNV